MSKTVLVVDDSTPVRQQVGLALTLAGYKVVEAFDGQDGVEKLAANKDVSMVICDVNMPRMTGLEFLAKVGTTLPIVMLTTEGHADLKKQAKALGAKGWIVKPFVPDLLVQTVRHLTGA
jgi:two-component system chemotaxis response regulator CheY